MKGEGNGRDSGSGGGRGRRRSGGGEVPLRLKLAGAGGVCPATVTVEVVVADRAHRRAWEQRALVVVVQDARRWVLARVPASPKAQAVKPGAGAAKDRRVPQPEGVASRTPPLLLGGLPLRSGELGDVAVDLGAPDDLAAVRQGLALPPSQPPRRQRGGERSSLGTAGLWPGQNRSATVG